MPRRHLLFWASKRRQKTRRECDSPLPTDVGSGNRTFPGEQSLPVLRYQVSNREYFLNLRFIEMFSLSQAFAGGGSGLTATRTINRTFSNPAVPALYGKRSYPSSGRPTVLSCAAIVVIPDSRAPIPRLPETEPTLLYAIRLRVRRHRGCRDRRRTVIFRLFSPGHIVPAISYPHTVRMRHGAGNKDLVRILVPSGSGPPHPLREFPRPVRLS